MKQIALIAILLILAGCSLVKSDLERVALQAGCTALLAEVSRFDPNHQFDDVEQLVLTLCGSSD